MEPDAHISFCGTKMSNRRRVITITISNLILLFTPVQTSSDPSCSSHLGLENGLSDLPALKLEDSMKNDASVGRLNNPSGAWCFTEEQVDGTMEELYLKVDMGVARLVTGFSTQGPPPEDESYNHNVAILVTFSTDDGVQWTPIDKAGHEFRSFAEAKDTNMAQDHFWTVGIVTRHLKFTIEKSNTVISKRGCLRFEILGCTQDAQPKSSMKLNVWEDGRIDVSWQDATVLAGVTWLPINAHYSISYFYQSEVGGTSSKVIVEDVGTNHTASVSSPFLGAIYTFKLTCIVGEMKFDCHSLETRAYPSCPANWLQSGPNCYFSDNNQLGWLKARTKCQKKLNNPNDGSPTEPLEANTPIWFGDKDCLNHPPEGIADKKCCATIKDPAQLLSMQLEFCEADEVKHGVCIIQHDVHFGNVINLKVTAIGATEVSVSWTNADKGWRPLQRSILIRKAHDEERGYDVLEDGDDSIKEWKEYSNMEESNLAPWTGLEANGRYVLLLRPKKEVPGLKTQFLLLPSGVVTYVNLDAYVNWHGSVSVRWEKVHLNNKDASTPVDRYSLKWYTKSDGETHGHTTDIITDTKFDILSPAFEETYVLDLLCHFGKETPIKCGNKQVTTGKSDHKRINKDSMAIVYTYNNEGVGWTKAESRCVKQGGHLTSVIDNVEHDTITKMAANHKPFWIGGTNCGGKSLRNWVDDLRWKYTKQIESFNNDTCCLQVVYVEDKGFIWKGALCPTPLAYVCKFQLTKVTSPVTDLKVEVQSPTQLVLRWKQPQRQWRPSHYFIHKCTVREPPVCSLVTTVKTSTAVLVTTLEPATDYTLKVYSHLEQLNLSAAAEVPGRTADFEVDTNLNAEGVMKIKWMKLIRENQVKKVCSVQFHPVGDESKKTTVKGTAGEMVIVGLKYNTEYAFVVSSDDGKEESYTFTKFTYPQCGQVQTQLGEKCFKLLEQPESMETGTKSCSKDGMVLADGKAEGDRLLLAVQSNEIGKELWLSGKTDETASKCRKVSPNTQDVKLDDCQKELGIICQKRVDVILLGVLSLSASDITETSVNVSWSPPQSWEVTSYKVIVKDGSRSKRAAEDSKEVNANFYKTTDLKPGTQYSVQVIPVMKTSAMELEGKAEVVQINTLETTTQLVITTPVVKAAEEEKGTLSTLEEDLPMFPDSLHTFHLIGCSFLVVLVALAFVIFVLCGMYIYRDVSAQLGFELSLLIVHALFLTMMADSTLLDCKPVAICIHFFFTAAFSFLMMEAICILKAATTYVSISLLKKQWHIFIAGWIPPLIVIGASAGGLHDQYPTEYPCTMRFSQEDMTYATILPIGILGGVTLVCLLLCFFCRPHSNYEVDEESYIRESVTEISRWVLLLLLVLLSASWACGMVGMDKSDESLLLIFIILDILLGVTVLILRCFGDSEARKRLRGLCSDGKVNPEESMEGALFPHNKLEVSPPDTAAIFDKGNMIFNRAYVFHP